MPAAVAFASVILAMMFALASCSGQTADTGGAVPAADPPQAAGPSARQPQLRDAGFFGVNTGPSDDFAQNVSLRSEATALTNFTFEARLRVDRISSAAAAAGITFLGDGNHSGFVFGLVPGIDRWKLASAAVKSPVAGAIEPGKYAIGSWHDLKARVTGDRIHLYIDGVEKASPEGIPRPAGSGPVGLKVRYASAVFDDVTLTDDSSGTIVFHDDFSGDTSGWKNQNDESWSVADEDDNQVFRGNVLLSPERLASAELSPEMATHLDQLKAAGVSSVRVFFSWDDIQAESSGTFSWNYYDAIAIAAHERGMELVAGLVYAPVWAIPQEHRDEQDYYAYPPVNDAEYARFVDAAVRRYMPGGDLSSQEGWGDGYGITAYEIGHEYNVGRIIQSDGRLFFSGWLGTLDQYVDLLKTGHDRVKAVCADCIVLNGAAGDDVPPAYLARRTDPGFQRQTVWQGVEDLYEKIGERNPGDPAAVSKYFDILNIHTYQWFMLTANGQLPDVYAGYSFPDPRWYSDRLARVIDVMQRHGDSDRDVWLTETSYASADSGDPYAGNLSESGQAQGLRVAYTQAAAFPQVKKVFWWYAFDLSHKIGLIRDDLSTKPSYEVYAELTGAR